LENIAIIEILAITRAIFPLPSVPHIWVVKTTREKFSSRIMNLVTIVHIVFPRNILSNGEYDYIKQISK
jgi:hypothetical protein